MYQLAVYNVLISHTLYLISLSQISSVLKNSLIHATFMIDDLLPRYHFNASVIQ